MDITHDTTDQQAWDKQNQKRQQMVRALQTLALPATYYYLRSYATLLFTLLSNSTLLESMTCANPTNHSATTLTRLMNEGNAILLSFKIPAFIGFISFVMTEKIKKYYPASSTAELIPLTSFLLNGLNLYQSQYIHSSDFMATPVEQQEPLSYLSPIIIVFLSLALQLKLLKQLSRLFHYTDDRPKAFHYRSTFIEAEFHIIRTKLPKDISLCPLYLTQGETLTLANKNIIRAILAPDGITYDYTNFTTWLAGLKKSESTPVTSPVTGKPMTGNLVTIAEQLYPNLIMQDILDGDSAIDCPISFDPYHQAVTDHHGHSYNERALRYWFFKSESHSCPLCPNHQITQDELRPNYSLRHYHESALH